MQKPDLRLSCQDQRLLSFVSQVILALEVGLVMLMHLEEVLHQVQANHQQVPKVQHFQHLEGGTDSQSLVMERVHLVDPALRSALAPPLELLHDLLPYQCQMPCRPSSQMQAVAMVLPTAEVHQGLLLARVPEAKELGEMLTKLLRAAPNLASRMRTAMVSELWMLLQTPLPSLARQPAELGKRQHQVLQRFPMLELTARRIRVRQRRSSAVTILHQSLEVVPWLKP